MALSGVPGPRLAKHGSLSMHQCSPTLATINRWLQIFPRFTSHVANISQHDRNLRGAGIGTAR